MSAVVALTARDVVKDHHAVAGPVIADSFTGTDHHTRGLVSEDAWSQMRPGCDLLEIGATDATGVHAYEKFAGSNGRHRDGLHTHVVLAAIDGGKHCGWDRVPRIVERNLSSDCHYSPVPPSFGMICMCGMELVKRTDNVIRSR